MACPFFLPREPCASGDRPERPRPPLGEFYHGDCTRPSETAPTPMPLELCNLGYARGHSCFADAAAPDAVRFSIVKDDGRTILIRYSIERDHRPEKCGNQTWNRALSAFAKPPPERTLHRQLRTYVNCYLQAKQKLRNS